MWKLKKQRTKTKTTTKPKKPHQLFLPKLKSSSLSCQQIHLLWECSLSTATAPHLPASIHPWWELTPLLCSISHPLWWITVKAELLQEEAERGMRYMRAGSLLGRLWQRVALPGTTLNHELLLDRQVHCFPVNPNYSLGKCHNKQKKKFSCHSWKPINWFIIIRNHQEPYRFNNL